MSACKSEDSPEVVQQLPRNRGATPQDLVVPDLPHETIDSGPVSNKSAEYPGAATAVTFQGHPTGLEADILGKMRAVNGALLGISVSDVMPWRPGYLFLVDGWAAKSTSADRLTNVAHADELFGLFVTNHELTKASRRVGLFVSPHPRGYKATLLGATRDSIIVCGEGLDNATERHRWAFAINPAESPSLRVQDSTAKLTLPRPPNGVGLGDDAEDIPEDYLPPQCVWTNGSLLSKE